MIWSSRERNRSCSLVSRRSRGRIANPPLHQLEREESRLAIRRNPQNRICKELAIQRPKTGKFDYLSAPNHPAHAMAFKFFTDDELLRLMPAAATANRNAVLTVEGIKLEVLAGQAAGRQLKLDEVREIPLIHR